MKVNKFEFGSLQEAWEGLNEYMATKEARILSKGGAIYGPEFVSYDNFVKVDRAWMDPEFDFGRIFGYTNKKWSSLINNYVDFNYLEMIRAEVNLRTNKNARNYNYAYHFANSHGSGKDCLISLNFMKRVGVDHPIILFTVRTSEITKRLAFDLLLVQRIAEYVYGHNDVEINIFLPSMFIAAEGFILYHNHKCVRSLYKGRKDLGSFEKRINDCLEKFLTVDPKTIKYKVHLRTANQLQKDCNGDAISGRVQLKVKDLILRKPICEKL